MLKKLLQTGVSLFMSLTIAAMIPGCREPSGKTLYEAATLGGSRKIVQRLINQGEDVNERDPLKGWTPLHAAAANGHPKMVKFLLDQGANVNARANDGSTPLHFAMAEHHEEVVSMLLTYSADRSIRNNLGKAPGDPR